MSLPSLNKVITYLLTALFINTQILKFKSQLTFAFFAAIIFLAVLLGNRRLLQWVQKVMVCDLWLVDFDPFCVYFSASFPVVLGYFGRACPENSPRTIAIGSKPPLVTRIARTGLGTRLYISVIQGRCLWLELWLTAANYDWRQRKT